MLVALYLKNSNLFDSGLTRTLSLLVDDHHTHQMPAPVQLESYIKNVLFIIPINQTRSLKHIDGQAI